MDNDTSVIYGLEFQARALAPQLAETEKIRFIIGTQSLKQINNQIHLVEFNEETSVLNTSVFHHSNGEIWKITSSPHDPFKISTCYNTFNNENICSMKTSILKFPNIENPNEVENLETVVNFKTENYGNEVKTNEFHPNDENKMVTVTENQLVQWDISGSESRVTSAFALEGKNNPKFTTGKWNPHQNCNQFATCTETNIKTWDVRSGNVAWQIESAHGQLVRDLDFNLNRQYHLATCGDDGFLKIWDFRQPNKPTYSRSDHSHWIWCVRFNPFHDQLILTASSDSHAILSSASSVSSEKNPSDGSEPNAGIIPDGPLQKCEHEDSVYCCEWSPAEPWTFASLSYDGRLLVTRVRRTYKYQILL